MDKSTIIVAIVIVGVGLAALIGDRTFGLLGGQPAMNKSSSTSAD